MHRQGFSGITHRASTSTGYCPERHPIISTLSQRRRGSPRKTRLGVNGRIFVAKSFSFTLVNLTMCALDAMTVAPLPSSSSHLRVPFIFVPDGTPPELTRFKADHPGWVRFRATFRPQPGSSSLVTPMPPMPVAETQTRPQETVRDPWPPRRPARVCTARVWRRPASSSLEGRRRACPPMPRRSPPPMRDRRACWPRSSRPSARPITPHFFVRRS